MSATITLSPLQREILEQMLTTAASNCAYAIRNRRQRLEHLRAKHLSTQRLKAYLTESEARLAAIGDLCDQLRSWNLEKTDAEVR
jgi:hypothetical protein